MYLCILSCFYIIIKLFWHIIFISFAGPSAAQQGGIFTVTEKKPPKPFFPGFGGPYCFLSVFLLSCCEKIKVAAHISQRCDKDHISVLFSAIIIV